MGPVGISRNPLPIMLPVRLGLKYSRLKTGRLPKRAKFSIVWSHLITMSKIIILTIIMIPAKYCDDHHVMSTSCILSLNHFD